MAAGVIAWTGGARVSIGPLRLSMRNPWRPLALGIALALVRWGIWRALPLLPAWHGTLRTWRRRLQAAAQWILKGIAGSELSASRAAERTSFTNRSARRDPIRYYVGGIVVLSLVPLWPHLIDLGAAPDPGDPFFSAWRLAWVAHQIVTAPRQLFDANIFYPTPLTFAYSDSVLVPALVAAPLLWAGVDPLVASNLVFLSAFPLTGVAFFLAARRLTGDLRASFIAGLLGALYPFHFEHYSHLELQFFLWVPLALVATLRLLLRPSLRAGAVLGLLVAAQWFSSMYFGIMLLTYLVPFTIVVALGWRIRPSRSLLHSMGVAALVLAITLPILVMPYVWSRAERGDRDLDVVELYSAVPGDYLEANRRSTVWADVMSRTAHQERQLFPGATPLLFSLVAVAPPTPVPAVAALVAGAFAVDWSLGVHGLTYQQLYRWVMPFRGMRVPARFAVFVGSSLILLAAYGLRRCLRAATSRRAQAGLFAVLVAAVMVDLWPSLELQRYWSSRPPIYEAVTREMVLAEFPMEVHANFAFQYFSTAHWARLLNGISGYIPDTYTQLAAGMQTFPSGDTLDLLRAHGATHLTVNCAFYEHQTGCLQTLDILDASPGVHLVSRGTWEDAEVRLYRLGS